MRDAMPMVGLEIVQIDEDFKIKDFYATQLGKTYVKVENCKTKNSINYEFSNLLEFLSKNNFSIKVPKNGSKSQRLIRYVIQ
jgi:hypothetical protein